MAMVILYFVPVLHIKNNIRRNVRSGHTMRQIHPFKNYLRIHIYLGYIYILYRNLK